MNRILIIAILILAPQIICAQKSHAPLLGWDLTYKTVLTSNRVAPNEWIWKWLGPNYESPIKPLIQTWNDGTIDSSFLLEWPAPHAGEHITMWFVRTKTEAFYYEEVDANPRHKTRKPLDVELFDKLFGIVSSWQQASPLKPENTPVGGIPGYDGFLSLYDRGNSRQLLLTNEDYVICDTKKCDAWKPGRLGQLLLIFYKLPLK